MLPFGAVSWQARPSACLPRSLWWATSAGTHLARSRSTCWGQITSSRWVLRSLLWLWGPLGAAGTGWHWGCKGTRGRCPHAQGNPGWCLFLTCALQSIYSSKCCSQPRRALLEAPALSTMVSCTVPRSLAQGLCCFIRPGFLPLPCIADHLPYVGLFSSGH